MTVVLLFQCVVNQLGDSRDPRPLPPITNHATQSMRPALWNHITLQVHSAAFILMVVLVLFLPRRY